MNHFTILQRRFMRLFSVLFLGLCTAVCLLGQTIITHDIGTGSLTIPATAVDTFVITGTTNTNKVIIQSGWHGKIILRNLSITSTSTPNGINWYGLSGYSCITVEGLNYQSNLNPVTIVNIVLDGNNTLIYNATYGNCGFCALQVNQGAQIHISAINPNENASGTLIARSAFNLADNTGPDAGAGIGAPRGVSNYSWGQGTNTITCSVGNTTHSRTAGGNIIISSGIVDAYGAPHSAGIGGGHYTYYDGLIIIYGGIVNTYGGYHSAAIGSGCPTGTGVTTCTANNSAIIALYPAEINAISLQGDDYGLAGASNITYFNDPNKSLITVHTVDTTPNANIYLDLTQNLELVNRFTAMGLVYDLTKVRVGRTSAANGMLSFRAELQQPTTFFTDANSIKPATLGRPYMPVVTTVTGSQNNRATVILPMLNMDISFTDYSSTPLETGYTATQAIQNAHRIKVSYNDIITMTNASYVLQDGIDFSSLIFLGSDSTTVISPPTTLTKDMIFYIVFPVDLGKPLGVYSDVLMINGKYGGISLPNYIRKVVQQRVVFDDSYTNNYIKVTASPDRFATTYPSNKTVKLTLNIDNTGTPVLYDHLDVVAKYLVTKIADYDLALAANPLKSGSWNSLNVPAVNNGNATTTVTFSSLPQETYYIHWYVESGVVYAHSLTVVAPPATHGGFGPYIVFSTLNAGTISGADTCNGYSIALSGTATTGGNGNYTYKWQNKNGSSGAWTNLLNSNSQNYITGTMTTGIYYFRRITYDSVIILTNNFPVGTDTSNIISVTVHPTYNITIDTAICFGERYNAYNFNIMPPAPDFITNVQNRKTIKGCDSIITLHLTVNPTYYKTIKDTICLGERYKQHGFDTLPPVAGYIQYAQELKTKKGCDSIITLQLTTNISCYDTINATICQNEIYDTCGFTITPHNSGFFTYMNFDRTSKNCDSITILNLTVNPAYEDYISAQIYEDEFYQVSDYQYNTPGIHITNLKTVDNCDSVIKLNLSVIYYPAEMTAFSPFTKDGINDYFMAGFKIQVFNRNGMLIYETKTQEELERGWDGRNYNKQQVEPGTYYYILYNSSGKQRTKSSVEVLKR